MDSSSIETGVRGLLSEPDITQGLAQLDGWVRQGDKLHKTFRFGGFPEAFGFMAACALVAEGMNHHPDWSNVYNQVHVDLSTHDAGGLTVLDFRLAARMDALAAARSA